MRLLVVEDNPSLLMMLEAMLRGEQFEIISCSDGECAWDAFQSDNPPKMALIDWMIPRIDGLELCKRVRSTPALRDTYILMLTAKSSRENIIAGLEAGANDYVVKPFSPAELRARLNVAKKVVGLQTDLARRVTELEEALGRVKTLEGMLPICCYCKKIRDDKKYWHRVESYIEQHANVEFSHGICPDCFRKHVDPAGPEAGREG